MSAAAPITVELDRVRPIKWTTLSGFRLDSIGRTLPDEFEKLRKGKTGSGYALAAILWASLEERDHGFADPLDLAEHLSSLEQKASALKAIVAMFGRDLTPSEKKSDNTKPKPSPASTSD